MKIIVNPDHIKRGRRGLCWACPVALAIAEALGGSCNPWISPEAIFITRHGRQVALSIPETVVEFMTRFDAGRSVQPFEFELSVAA